MFCVYRTLATSPEINRHLVGLTPSIPGSMLKVIANRFQKTFEPEHTVEPPTRRRISGMITICRSSEPPIWCTTLCLCDVAHDLRKVVREAFHN